MSRSARSQFKSASKLRDRAIEQEALSQIRDFLEGCLGSDDSKPWELSQEEAEEIHENRQEFPILMEQLRAEGKSAGARYIAARINSGADPDLYQLTMDWFAHRNIKRELSKEELAEIGASAMDLRMLGIKGQREAREFYKLYREVFVKSAGWGSCYQPNHYRVKAIATTPNYNRLPLWVKKILLNTPWIETGDRIGNIWRLIPCAKAWKHAPSLPKNLAEKVGKMSVEARYLAFWAWENACEKILSGSLKSKSIRHFDWQAYAVSRSQLIEAFWIELRRLQSVGLSSLIAECYNEARCSRYAHNKLRNLAEIVLNLPHGFLFEAWGRHKHASQDSCLEAIATHGSPEDVCRNLFGNAGKRTVELFKSASKDAWRWASAVCEENADAIQKVLATKEIIAYQPDAIEFLKSLPMQSRVRLLAATTFKYRGAVHPISDDYVRDTGYLWKNIPQKPELGRIRCWFSAHEQLSAAFVKSLPDEALPIPQGWERVDGLCSIDGSWSLEFPRRVATLKYYGEALRNCVGGYGPAIKSGRSIIFVVRERGILTHCVEVCGNYINQFYRSGNSSPDSAIKNSVCEALRQARLIS